MIKELDKLRETVETQCDWDKARALADAYVKAHPDEFTEFAEMTLPSCVAAVDVFRAANMLESQWRVEAWLLHHFEPQSIGGDVQHQVRIPNDK